MAVPLIEFVHPDDRAATLAARSRLVDGAPLPSHTNRYRCKDGSYRWFDWRSIPNVPRRLVYAIARDVTAEREAQRALHEAREATQRLERQLVVAERMASLGTLSAGVAHEINNPLAYVLTNVELVTEGLVRINQREQPDSELSEYIAMLTEARTGAERIRSIVSSLKTFSRSEEEHRTDIEVLPILELAIQLAWNEVRHRARLVRDYGPMPVVHADESRLGQVFINLLINAAQALGDDHPEDSEIRVVAGTDVGGNLFVEIADTGPGIAPELLDRIFDPFFTTKPIGIGTGLGLSLCHSIVTGSGGFITVSNREPHGASFRVTLPAARRTGRIGSVRHAVGTTSPVRADSPRASVLVIDDERSIGDILRRRLRQHDVTAFTSARDALDLLTRSSASVDVILSDVMMPDMSGIEFYAELGRVRPELVERVVFMSGGAFTGEAQTFLSQIPNQLIEKPFTFETLRAAIDRLLGTGGPPPAQVAPDREP
jgi:signal transduction histidine kinase/CheY-like chemotaxis protein